jgi:hypothetical protein
MQDTMTTEQKLNQIADFQSQADLLQMELQRLLDDAMPPELKGWLDEIKLKQEEIRAEFDGKAAVVSEKIEKLKAEVTAEVIANGSTIKGEFLQCQYTKGRVSWDAKTLDGYALGHPEILMARKEGQPFVSFKNNGK